MQSNGYPANFLRDENARRRPRDTNTKPEDYMYFEFPYINDTIDRQVRKIFKEIEFPVRIYRKSYTLRNALRDTPRTQECRMKNCQLNNDQCLIRNCVYQLTCSKCHEIYIGSTTRTFHTRFKEHMTVDTSSVSAHKTNCQASFTTKIIARDHDPIKLRFKEAILIQRHSASINSRAEREELQHLIT